MIDINQLISDAQQTVNEFEVEYRLKHGTNVDFGCCGYGHPSIRFGRKRKLREYLQNNGIRLSKDHTGAYWVMLPIEKKIHVQNADFNQGLAYRLTDVIKKHIGDKVEYVSTYTWID